MKNMSATLEENNIYAVKYAYATCIALIMVKIEQ